MTTEVTECGRLSENCQSTMSPMIAVVSGGKDVAVRFQGTVKVPAEVTDASASTIIA